MPVALSINHLKKTYPNGFVALKGINLEVNHGDFFALLGPNGAGKSTIIGIISSLVNKTDGKVSVFGFDMDKDLSAAKMHIGLVPQEFNFNIFEPIAEILINQAGYFGIARKNATKRAKYLLELLGLWDKRKEPPRNLSGGMKRRLMIARALMHEPRLLILDEPTAGVDIEIRLSMWNFLQEINGQGTTIILTTHYLEEAEKLCRNIAIIDHGEIIENSDMRSLLSRINTETFILDIEVPLPHELTIPNYPIKAIDERTLEVEITREQDLNTVFQALSKNNINVLSMRNKANRLEELFIGLVDKDKAKQ